MLGASALLLACVACGQNEEIGFGAPPANDAGERSDVTLPTEPLEPPAGDPMKPAPPPGGVEVAEAKVDASALPEGYPKLVWTEADGAMVGVYGQAGGCIEATGSVTEQSAQQVVFLITETNSGGQVCTMDLRFPPLTVKLDAPLGDRTVVLQRTQVGPR